MSADVDPMKSGHGQHVQEGIPGWAADQWPTLVLQTRAADNFRAAKVAWTMQAPCQIFMLVRPVCSRDIVARLMSGRNKIG